MHLTPAEIHTIDQRMAEARTHLNATVTMFRDHIDEHHCDPTCAYAGIIATCRANPTGAAWMLAAAIQQLATPPGRRP